MPLSAPRTPNPANRRQTILHATLRVIGTGGVDSVTNRRVAAAAGVPLGSMTYHFESRDHLVAEAFRYYLGDILSAARTVAQELESIEGTSLVDGLVSLSARDLAQPELVQAEFELYVYAARNAEIADDLSSWDAIADAGVAHHLEAAGIARPLEGARALRGTIRGFELERLSRDVSLDELRSRLELTLSGLRQKRAVPLVEKPK